MPMQPRPWAETSGPLSPSLRVFIVLTPLRVHLDLVVDHEQAALEVADPIADLLAVVSQQLLAGGSGVIARADQFRVAEHVRDRHPGQPHLADELQPAQVAVAVAPSAAPPARVSSRPGPLTADVLHQPD